MRTPSTLALAGIFCLVPTAPSLAAQDLLWSTEGESTYENVGKALAALEDFDGDGVRDLILGAPGAKNATGQTVGQARIVSGATGQILHTLEGSQAYASFGSVISSGVDCNGDGWPDFAISATGYDTASTANAGQVTLYSGRTLQVIRTWEGGSSNTEFGSALALIDDINGDGLGDILCGAHKGATYGGNLNGLLFAWSGADGSTIHQLEGKTVGDHFGWAIAALGDTNGDGRPEFVVGAPYANPAGEAYLINGATGATLHTIYGAQNDDRWGRSVCAAPDLDGDNRPDFIVASPEVTIHSMDDTGQFQIYSSATGAALLQVDGEIPGGFFADTLALTGVDNDFNGDFFPDLLIGMPRRDPNSLADAGTVQLWSLNPPELLHSFHGNESGELLGASACTVPAATGSLYSKFWLGAPGATSSSMRQAGRSDFWRITLPPFLMSSPLSAGTLASFDLFRLLPQSEATILASFKGNGPTPTPYGWIDLSPPFQILPPQVSTVNGQMSLSVYLPPSLQGRPVWLQGANRWPSGEILFSNPLAKAIQ